MQEAAGTAPELLPRFTKMEKRKRSRIVCGVIVKMKQLLNITLQKILVPKKFKRSLKLLWSNA
jgi:hypothetical protein